MTAPTTTRQRKRSAEPDHYAVECQCGQTHAMPLRAYEAVQAAKTATVTYGNGNCGAWRVPRMWIALHDWPREADLPGLGEMHGWERVA